MSTLDLIYAIAAGDSQESESLFNSLLGDRITAAIDAKREEVAKSLFNEAPVKEDYEVVKGLIEAALAEDTATLTEAVDHYDIDSAIRDHHWEHSDGRHSLGHAARADRIEDHINQRHGAKALKHVQAHTNAMIAYRRAEMGTSGGLSKEEYQKTHKPKIQAAIRGARAASHDHQRKAADSAPASV